MSFDDDYSYIPPSDDDNYDNEPPPIGVPTLDRGNRECPFCLKPNKNLQTHILKCYIKACQRKGIRPLCTCPEHKGLFTHNNSAKRKQRRTNSNPSTSDHSSDQSAFSLDNNVTNIDNNTQLFSQLSQSTTQGPHINNQVFGESRVCISKFFSNLHQCGNSRITSRSVKLELRTREFGLKDIFVCTTSVFASNYEESQIKDIVKEYMGSDENIEEEKLINGTCFYSGCNKQKVRSDIGVMKPQTTSRRVNDTDSLYFCSIEHMMKWLQNLSETRWDKKILVKNCSDSSNFIQGNFQ